MITIFTFKEANSYWGYDSIRGYASPACSNIDSCKSTKFVKHYKGTVSLRQYCSHIAMLKDYPIKSLVIVEELTLKSHPEYFI